MDKQKVKPKEKFKLSKLRYFLERNKIFFELFSSILLGLMGIILSIVAINFQSREIKNGEKGLEPDIWLDVNRYPYEKPDTIIYTIKNDGYRVKKVWFLTYSTSIKINLTYDSSKYGNNNSSTNFIQHYGYFNEGTISNHFRSLKNNGDIAIYKCLRYKALYKYYDSLFSTIVNEFNKKYYMKIKIGAPIFQAHIHISYTTYLDEDKNYSFYSEDIYTNAEKFDRFIPSDYDTTLKKYSMDNSFDLYFPPYCKDLKPDSLNKSRMVSFIQYFCKNIEKNK